jgi:hypothetical protein
LTSNVGLAMVARVPHRARAGLARDASMVANRARRRMLP